MTEEIDELDDFTKHVKEAVEKKVKRRNAVPKSGSDMYLDSFVLHEQQRTIADDFTKRLTEQDLPLEASKPSQRNSPEASVNKHSMGSPAIDNISEGKDVSKISIRNNKHDSTSKSNILDSNTKDSSPNSMIYRYQMKPKRAL